MCNKVILLIDGFTWRNYDKYDMARADELTMLLRQLS